MKSETPESWSPWDKRKRFIVRSGVDPEKANLGNGDAELQVAVS